MSNKFQVLEVCESYNGGVKRQVDYLNEYIDNSKFELTTLVSSKRGGNISGSFIVDDNMSYFPNNIFKFIKSFKTIHNIVVDKNISLIHAHSTIAGIVVIMYKILYFSKIPIVYTPHAYYSEISRGWVKDFLLITVEKFMSNFFSMNIHVSEEEENYAFDSGIVSKKESTVVNNGVPDSEYEVKMDNVKELRFVNVARCDYQKNPELFIKIAKTICEIIPNVNFTWVGDGPLFDQCIKQVKNINLEDKIKFVGYSSNPFKYLNSSDIFLSTSRYEGQPFSVIEALSVGLPLILTDIVGHRELVSNNGRLITNKEILNKNNLCSLFEFVIENKNDESIISRKLFEKKYNVKEMVKGIESVYKKVV
ncbi:glycosyltransferase [Companilactobacillus nantensis]|uniref:Glycosyltransferase n=1 Tax=Companilactobacillus nantensis DSM 16982 TaxID=1423774 RepID=A0A0R1WBF0_9LACO|nr:glycosyltransferase [Companilactobacillus nantensis]KRM15288.1 hypothetical protein FD31_GL001296 [Companilactobacillus nantensis DSM 16982]GEO64383.1 hypothetical protein LNA01_15660 [Companilactobacillus nantensis]